MFHEDTDIARREEEQILNHLRKVIKNYDLVIVSDYGHGPDQANSGLFVQRLYLALNVQTNSANIGFNLVTIPRANCVP